MGSGRVALTAAILSRPWIALSSKPTRDKISGSEIITIVCGAAMILRWFTAVELRRSTDKIMNVCHVRSNSLLFDQSENHFLCFLV